MKHFKRLLFGTGVGFAAVIAASGADLFAHGSGHDGNGNDGVDVCVFTKHGAEEEHAHNARGGPGGGGGGGGGKTPSCGKTYAKWTKSNLNVYIDGTTGAPSTALATGLLDYAQQSLTEWAAYSGLGESVTITYVGSAASADITVGWGNLGTTGILGQTATPYSRGTITGRSTITMNSNTSGVVWTLGPTPTTSSGRQDEVGNDASNPNYDLFSVIEHEIGHALGIAHPSNKCVGSDPCYAETMYSCTDNGEFMRRALNPGDQKAIAANYGSP